MKVRVWDQTAMNKIKKLLPAILSGTLLSLPWLLPNAGWLMLIAFVPLLYADEQNHKNSGSLSSVFITSYASFLIWNVATCWWISYVSVTGMLLITTLNSLLMASVWWGKSFVRKRLDETSGYFALLTLWITFEFLHQHWSLRWPWLTLGNGFADSVKLIQWYEYTGVLGGSLWILGSNILFFNTIKHINQKSKERINNAIAALLIVSVPIILSLTTYHNYIEKSDPVHVVVLQPNIDPFTEKFSGMCPAQQVGRLVQLADSTTDQTTDFILAPETSLPNCSEDSTIKKNPEFFPILDLIKKYPNVDFVAGAITKRQFATSEKPTKTARLSSDERHYYDLYNSSLLIDTSSTVQICHKSILVSGVERMPFQEYFSFLRKYLIDLGGASGSFAAASEPEIFKSQKQIEVGPAICFESAFGELSAALARKGARIVFVMTNDGWWKRSIGSWQHFNYSRIRAIETRRCVARSANTGISGFINQRGDVLKQTKINETTAIKENLNLNAGLTFYVRHSDLLGHGSLILTALIVFYLIYKRLNAGCSISKS